MMTTPKSMLTLTGAAVLAAFGVFQAPLAIAPAHAQAARAAVQPAAPAATSPQLDQAVAALRGVSTLRADFTPTDRNGQRVNGVITLKRPGRIRFQYAPGVPMLIVSDGSSLNLIDYEVRQVQRWPIRNSPLGALLDPSRDVSRYGRLQPTAEPNGVSVEVRDRVHPEYGVITLIFVRKASAPGGLELVSWVTLDSQNRRTTIRLTNHQYGLAVPDSVFRWNDPRSPTRR